MNSLKEILEKIKNLRNQKGISQTKMAKELGVSQPGYANIENGGTDNIPLSVAVGIAKVLNVGFNELFDIDGDSQKIEVLNSQIEELKVRVEELKEQKTEKDLLLKSIKNQNNFLKNYLISSTEVSNIDRINNLKDKLEICNDENEKQKLIELIDHYQKNRRRQYNYYISIGMLEQSDIDEHFEGLKEHYEMLIKLNNM